MSADSAELFHENGFARTGRILSREEAGAIRALVERFERELHGGGVTTNTSIPKGQFCMA